MIESTFLESAATLEELHGTFVLHGSGTRREGTQIATLACSWILLARVQAAPPIFQFADHRGYLNSHEPAATERVTPDLTRDLARLRIRYVAKTVYLALFTANSIAAFRDVTIVIANAAVWRLRHHIHLSCA